MSLCEDCSIEEKLLQCCGRHPMSGETVILKLHDGRNVTACPHLDSLGKCSIYANRPNGCIDFHCAGFDEYEWINRDLTFLPFL